MPSAAQPTAPSHATLPRRDLVLLPLIALATLMILLGSGEVLARYFFSEEENETCVASDPLVGYRIKANCTSTMKAAEGPVVENAFNNCGYRSREPCGPKPPDTIRVAMLGASFSEGFLVPYDDIFTARATGALTDACHKRVEFQNLSVAGYSPLSEYLRLDEALALHPDVVLLTTTPYEVGMPLDPTALAERHHPRRVSERPEKSPPTSLVGRVRAMLSDSRMALAAQHFLFKDAATFVRLWLMYGDKADFLRPPFTSAWEGRFQVMDMLLGEMAQKVHRAGASFVLLIGAQRIEAVLLDPHLAPPAVDARAFGRRMARIAAKHGIVVYDSLDALATVTQPQNLFYPVDGHLDGRGHAVLAAWLETRLKEGSIPAFADCGASVQSRTAEQAG